MTRENSREWVMRGANERTPLLWSTVRMQAFPKEHYHLVPVSIFSNRNFCHILLFPQLLMAAGMLSPLSGLKDTVPYHRRIEGDPGRILSRSLGRREIEILQSHNEGYEDVRRKNDREDLETGFLLPVPGNSTSHLPHRQSTTPYRPRRVHHFQP